MRCVINAANCVSLYLNARRAVSPSRDLAATGRVFFQPPVPSLPAADERSLMRSPSQILAVSAVTEYTAVIVAAIATQALFELVGEAVFIVTATLIACAVKLALLVATRDVYSTSEKAAVTRDDFTILVDRYGCAVAGSVSTVYGIIAGVAWRFGFPFVSACILLLIAISTIAHIYLVDSESLDDLLARCKGSASDD